MGIFWLFMAPDVGAKWLKLASNGFKMGHKMASQIRNPLTTKDLNGFVSQN